MADRAERDLLMPIGIGIMVAGLLFTAVALVPLFTSVEIPSVFWALSMLTGVGLALALAALLRRGVRRSRSQRRATLA